MLKILRIIFFSPLALIRLLLVLFMSAFVVFVGWIWISIFGFSRELQRWVLQTWGKSILFFLGIKIDRNKIPDSDNYILMPNHRSYIDIFIVAALTPSSMVGKAELQKWPFGKIGSRITHTILVNREELKSLVKTMNRIKNSVNKGIPVALFPEGTTFKGPLTKTFKNGSFKIAADTQIPVIPMAIEYYDKNDAWVGNDTFVGHFFRQMGKPVSKVVIRFGEPIIDPDYKSLQTKTRQQIHSMLNKITATMQH